MANAIPPLDEEALQGVCDVVAATEAPPAGTGLTGSEISRYLSLCGIPDVSPASTKRHRLYDALSAHQKKFDCANGVFDLLLRVMKPVSYRGNEAAFAARRDQLNSVLAFAGYYIGEDGQARRAAPAKTIPEAQARAGNLLSTLSARKVHPQVLKFCKPELLQKNYFHAVFEAVKGIASRIRSETGLTKDGAELMETAFRKTDPFMIINEFIDDSHRSEQSGFQNLLTGIFGMLRNPRAHAAKEDSKPIQEEEAIDLLTIVSFAHKTLDKARVIKRASA